MSNPFETGEDEGYNPFAASSTPSNYSANDISLGAETVRQETYDYPSATPNANPESKLTDGITGLNISEKDILEREKVLQRREQLIQEREKQIEEARANGTLESLNTHKRNFPPLVNFYKYYPEEDLPQNVLSLMNLVKWMLYVGAIILAYNFVCALFYLAPGVSETLMSPAATIVFSAIYLCVVVPLSFELGMMPMYNALKQGKGLKFFWAMLFFLIYALFFVYIIIGFGSYGSVGWITSINAFGAKQGKWVAVLSIIFSIAGTLFCVFAGYVWWLMVVYFRGNDISKKAVGEAAGIAANYANDHKEDIVKVAKENPDLVMKVAANGTYT